VLETLQAEILEHRPTCRRGEGFADTITVDDGVINGRAVPYRHTIDLGGVFERFEPGAFADQVKDPSRVKVCLEHGQPVGLVTRLEERADGLHFTAEIPNEPDIPETMKARAMIRRGIADELSVGFNSLPGGTTVEHDKTRATYVHRRARLLEISLVPWGAYGRGATLTRSALLDPEQEKLKLARAEARSTAAAWLAKIGEW